MEVLSVIPLGLSFVHKVHIDFSYLIYYKLIQQFILKLGSCMIKISNDTRRINLLILNQILQGRFWGNFKGGGHQLHWMS